MDTHAGVITGQLDVELSEEGRRQIREAAHEIARLGPVRIVSSDLRRAAESAAIVARELGLPAPALDPRWRERHWGVRQGTPRSPVRAEADRDAPEGGESEAALDERVALALSDCGSRTLIVAHAGALRAARRVLGLDALDVALAGHFAVGTDRPCAGRLRLVGETITRGRFTGRVVHVASPSDLPRVEEHSLVVLHRIAKGLAVEVLARAGAGVNLTRALTAHLTHGRTADKPYAVALFWPDGLPADDDEIELIIESQPRAKRHSRVVPDPVVLAAPNASRFGGKGSGLHLLRALSTDAAPLLVPEFHVIPVETVENAAQCAAFCKGFQEGRWAVRSSADVEDSSEDPMSGSFCTVLDVPADGLERAVREVAASVHAPEIESRLLAGSLRSRPRMAVVVQRMIGAPKFAGAVFLPAPNETREGLLEARRGQAADALMDGTAEPDIRIRFTAQAELTELDGAASHERVELQAVVTQAVAIQRMSGRGDLEFAVDASGAVQWLQARELRSVIEVVDRSGFHPASAGYYRLLAASVAHANLTQPVHFRLVELGDGRFGYTHGIRARDEEFHCLIARDPTHLSRVTEHGWETSRRLRDLLARSDTSPRELWGALVMHGGVQLPFSIPMRGVLMERYDSWSSDDGGGSGMLEDVLESILGSVNGAPGVHDAIRLLRTPLWEHSAAAIDRALARLMRAGSRFADTDVLAVLSPDLRDLPRLDAEGMHQQREKVLSQCEAFRAKGLDANALERRADETISSLAEARVRRAQLIERVRSARGEAVANDLARWSEYLAMKADTNEYHALARGEVFVRLAQTGFSPSDVEVRISFEALMRGEDPWATQTLG